MKAVRDRLQSRGLTGTRLSSRLQQLGLSGAELEGFGEAHAGGMVTTDMLTALARLDVADSSELAVLRQASSRVRPDTGGPGSHSPAVTPARAAFDAGIPEDVLRDRLATTEKDSSAHGGIEDAITALTKEGQRVFGLGFFRRGTSAFEPISNGPVSGDYRLGPGDQLVVLLTGDVEAGYTAAVTREGVLVLPNIGQFPVASLSLDQARSLLLSSMARVLPGVRRDNGGTTKVTITVGRVRAIQVMVTGEVVAPGSYQVAGTGTALTALYAAGGPADRGSLRAVQIRRRGVAPRTIDLYAFLLRGDTESDLTLEPGDVLFVPPTLPRVRVVGEVVRPGTYEVLPTESLADILSAAGGFAATAARRLLEIQRVLPPSERRIPGKDRVLLSVDGQDAALRATRTEDGDVIRVGAVGDALWEQVTVRGHVWRGGRQAFRPGMHLSDALAAAGGPRPGVHTGRVLVSRLNPDSSRALLATGFRDSSGALIQDLPLQDRDEIVVFAASPARAERTVAIGGAVRAPGTYPYHDGMTLRDLVLLAGGPTLVARLDTADLVRFAEAPTTETPGIPAQAPIDSTYVPGTAGLPSPDVALRPFDNVTIRQRPGTQGARAVVVEGLVQFPGRYALLNGAERLTDVLQRAGGLTPGAYPAGISLYRGAVGKGRVGIDARRALRDPKDPDNVGLADGDSIVVPAVLTTVSVLGAVNQPTTLAWVPGAKASTYVRRAGGATAKGDARRAFVEQPGGRLEAATPHRLRPDTDPTPLPGATILVPDAAPRAESSAALTATLQVLGTLLTAVAIFRN